MGDPEATVRRLLAEGDARAATAETLRAYGPQMAGYLTAILRDEDDVADVFSQFAEDLFRGIAGFRWECSLRAWLHKLAWSAVSRFGRDPWRKRGRRLETSEISELAQHVLSSSAAERNDRMAKLRASLDAEEQTLLILRLDRDLSWREVSQVLSVGEAALRKRFERLRQKLAKQAREEGLL